MSSSRGAVLPLIALVIAACVIGVLLLAATLARVLEHSDCQHAADAAALAGVVEGQLGASELAAANHASIVTFDATDHGVEVVVDCGSVRAGANAERRLVADDGD